MIPADRTTGIILAAGASGRFPSFKPAALMYGRPMLHHCLLGLGSVCERMIVVGGSNLEALRLLLEAGDAGPAELVENPAWKAGMFTSVKAGVARVQTDTAFVLPVDCPLVPRSVYRALLAASGAAVVPVYRKRRGHPVLLRRELFGEILAEADESSLRGVLARCAVVEVEVEAPEVLMDLDTREDLERLATDG